MKCQTFEKNMAAYLDGSLSDARKAKYDLHIQKCAACKSELKSLQAILSEAKGLEVKKAPDTLWPAIERELDSKPPQPRVHWMNRVTGWFEQLNVAYPMPIYAKRLSAAVALILVGVLAGRYLPQSWEQPTSSRFHQMPAERILLANRTTNYFEKSKVLFLGLVNASPHDFKQSTLPLEKKFANNLIQEAHFLKNNLPGRQHARLRALVEELELILLEIANIEAEYDPADIELIKSGIEQKGLLLKINLHGLTENIAAEERPM